jgi:uncharacterized phage protein (TIGR01671 family)
MRKILFRAKSCVGNWVYGYLKKQLVGDNPDVWAIQTETPPDKPLITAAGDLRLYENVVDPATVGQWTGLRDKNGTKIFEGDVISISSSLNRGNCVGAVRFGEYKAIHSVHKSHIGFYIEWYDEEYRWLLRCELGLWVKEQKAEVVGNIHAKENK